MNLRLALHELAAEHGLDANASRRLQQLAGFDAPPPALVRLLPRGLAVLAAALLGFGLVMWIAANWDTLGRFGRFALLMGFTAAMGAGAVWRPQARAPLALLALLAIGGLFAYFGQTYQTGADAWQLFALWAALALPLCLGARSDVLWAPWALVVMVAISLWTHAHLGQRWSVQPEDLSTHVAAGLAAAVVVGGLSRGLQHYTGAGLWGLRTAVTLAVVMLTFTSLSGLFHDPVAPHYLFGVLLLAGGAALLAWRPAFDVFALSAVALGLNTLVTCGLGRALFHNGGSNDVGAFLFIGVVAAGLLAASVSAILRLARRYGALETVTTGAGHE